MKGALVAMWSGVVSENIGNVKPSGARREPLERAVGSIAPIRSGALLARCSRRNCGTKEAERRLF